MMAIGKNQKTVLNWFDRIMYVLIKYTPPTWKKISSEIANDTKTAKGGISTLSMNQNALKRKYERYFAANY